jgi:ABC-type transport system involved in multi-copper enzyme maturation permease subunit
MNAKPPPVPRAKRRLDAFEATFQVAQLTAKRTLKGRRALVALLVVALPAALGFLVRHGRPGSPAQESFLYGMLSTYHFGIAVPFVALVFSTAFPWPEAEEGTLTYWFTSPIPRWTVLLGRWSASLVVGWAVLAVGVLAIALPLDTRPEADTGAVVRSALAATLLAFPAYLALFQLAATVLRRCLVFGVVFIFVENVISVIPSATIVRFTIVYYVRSRIWPAVPPGSRALAESLLHVAEPASDVASLAAFAGVTAVALVLSLLAVEAIEYRGRTAQPG